MAAGGSPAEVDDHAAARLGEGHDVDPVVSVQNVVPGASVDAVLTGARQEPVASGAAVQHVVSLVAADDVVAAEPRDRVVTAEPVDHVPAAAPPKRVVARGPPQGDAPAAAGAVFGRHGGCEHPAERNDCCDAHPGVHRPPLPPIPEARSCQTATEQLQGQPSV